MRSLFFVCILCALFVVGCKGTRPQPEEETRQSVRVPDSTIQPAVALPGKTSSYEERQGAFLYGKYCAVCHGQEGKGDGFNAFNLDPRPRDFSDSASMKRLSDGQIIQTISGGGRSVNKSPLMPSYGWTLSRQQILYLADFVRSRSTDF
jgi:mono/diheme cytochrome c family protein